MGASVAVATDREVARPGWVDALLVFGAVAAVAAVVVWLGARGPLTTTAGAVWSPYPGSGLFGGWYHYDAGWYAQIATEGYRYQGPDRQSSVAFFPAYPMGLRFLHAITGVSVKLLGTLFTLACGAGVAVLFRRWCEDRVGRRVALMALVTLLLYPYAFFLMGAVYADALFLLAAVAAFVLLERGHPVLAGLAGAVATATRPVGVAVVVGLVAVTLWRKGTVARREGRLRIDLRTLRPADAGVLLSVAGLVGWMTYLGVRFGNPLAFEEVQQAPGWGQGSGPRTWFKLRWFEQIRYLPGRALDWYRTGSMDRYEQVVYALGILLQGALVLFFLWLAWKVWKRFGWGYGLYCFVVIAIPLLGTRDFQGSGRYLLAAFPCFAVAADLLSERVVLRRGVWITSGALLLAWTFSFGRGYYVS